jgi:hypothetical protein
MFEAPQLYSIPARICLGIAICGGRVPCRCSDCVAYILARKEIRTTQPKPIRKSGAEWYERSKPFCARDLFLDHPVVGGLSACGHGLLGRLSLRHFVKHPSRLYEAHG